VVVVDVEHGHAAGAGIAQGLAATAALLMKQ
jgi:hypothetical protein